MEFDTSPLIPLPVRDGEEKKHGRDYVAPFVRLASTNKLDTVPRLTLIVLPVPDRFIRRNGNDAPAPGR